MRLTKSDDNNSPRKNGCRTCLLSTVAYIMDGIYLDQEPHWFDECFYSAGSKHPVSALRWVEIELLINEQCVSVNL